MLRSILALVGTLIALNANAATYTINSGEFWEFEEGVTPIFGGALTQTNPFLSHGLQFDPGEAGVLTITAPAEFGFITALSSESYFGGTELEPFGFVDPGDSVVYTMDGSIYSGIYWASIWIEGPAIGAINEYYGGSYSLGDNTLSSPTSVVPVPAAVWLFGSALLGLGVVKRRKA